MSSKIISVADFGARPENENNMTQLRKAIENCRGRKGLTLRIPPGVYHISDEEAIELRETVMDGKFGDAFEKMMFFPYAPYISGLHFGGCEDLTIDAEGAILLCDGFMEPVSLERCKNVTLKGLTIDYKRKPFSSGKIVRRDKDSFDVKLDPEYPVKAGTPCSRTMFWNKTKNHLCRTICWPKKVMIAPQIMRLTGPVPEEDGEIIASITHTLHFRPAILIQEAENITLNHVTIHAQPGMGIVGNRGHNITLYDLRIIPSPGIHFSTNTDGTHFTSCTGLLLFDHCHIEGQADDSTNIHNYYYTVAKIIEESADRETVRLRVDAPTGTHAQVLEYPDVGDLLELVEIETLNLVSTFKVLTVSNNPEEWYCDVTIQGHLPPETGRYMLSDITRLPRVIIRNSHFCNNAGRILIKTRDVLIENNVIENNLGSGVFVGAESWWKEGTTCNDVVVRNNKILRCAAGITVCASAKDSTAKGLNKRITIEKNTIEGAPQTAGIVITNAEDIQIRDNHITDCKPGIRVDYSQNITITGNSKCPVTIGPHVTGLKQK